MVEMKKKYNNVILLIALGLIAIIYILRHNFLITTYTYAIVIAAISIVVTLIAFIFKVTRQKDKVLFGIKSFVMLYISIWTLFYSYCYVQKSTNVQTAIVPINGYYTRRTDGVLFTFQDKHFDRKAFIPNYSDSLIDKYVIKLELVEVISNVYYINKLHVIPKN